MMPSYPDDANRIRLAGGNDALIVEFIPTRSALLTWG